MCYRDSNFASVSTNVLLNLGTVLTLRYLFGFPVISHNYETTKITMVFLKSASLPEYYASFRNKNM